MNFRNPHVFNVSNTALFPFALLCAVLATTAVAADETPTTTDESANTGWQGEISMGINSMNGNVDSKNANLGVKLDKNVLPWRYHVLAKASAADVSDTRISEQYQAAFQTDYVLPNEHYWFGYAGYDSDKFASIDKRFTEAAGYGFNIITTPKQKLDLELGLGARQSTYTGDYGKEYEAIAHTNTEYSLKLTDNTTFSETLVMQPSNKNTFTHADTSLQVAMSKKTSLKLTYGYNHNSEVFPGTKKTDTTTSANIVIGF